MIVVTGAAGFIGSNLIKALTERGYRDLVAVDDLADGHKFHNLADCDIADYWDKSRLLELIEADADWGADCEAVFHQGACSDTTEWDGRYMMEINYEYSIRLYHYCTQRNIPFIYASSASVYGLGPTFVETPEHEAPLNLYAYSKCLFDRYVRRHAPTDSQVVGLRYFNVYGPREAHKGKMSSIAWQLNEQLREGGRVQLFADTDGYGPGEQRRDFVYVDDVTNVNIWCFEHPAASGIFNVGTGASQTFNDVANAVIAWHGRGHIEYIPFPQSLAGHYQSYTQADISALRAAGYDAPFLSVEQGVRRYLDVLAQRRA